MSSEKKTWERDILGWASSDFNSLELPLIRKKKKNSWIVRREILRPDQTFFFTTTFDREQERCSSQQPCKRCRSSTRAQGSKNIWDLSESGLGQGINFLDDEKEIGERKKNRSWSSHISTSYRTFFFLHIFIQMVLLVYIIFKIWDTTMSSASSLAMERSFEKLSMQSAKTSVWAGHSALQK